MSVIFNSANLYYMIFSRFFLPILFYLVNK